MTIPPLSLGLIKGAEWLKALNAEMFLFGQAHGHMNKSAEHTSVHALAGRLQAGPSGNLELTVPSSLIKGVFDALDEPGAEFVVRNNRTESAIKVMTKEEVDKLGGVSHISERGHSYHYTLGPIVELPATGDYDKLWAISIKSNDLEDIRKSYGLETSPQLGFYIPVGCKKKRVTEDNAVSKLAGVYTASGDKVQGVGLRKMYHSLLEEQGLPGLGVNNEDTGDVELSFDGDEAKRQEVFNQLGSRVQAKTGHPVTFAPVDIPQSSVPVSLSNKDTERLNAIHHLAYRMSNMYDPADPLLDSNDNFKQKLADRFRLQVNQRGLKGTVPSRAAEQLLGTRPMYEGMMPARRTRSEEEALSDMAEEQKLRLLKALKGGRGFLAPNESSVSKPAGLLKQSVYWSKDVSRDLLNGRKYPLSYLTGELGELGESVKNMDWPNFKEELGDSAYAAQMILAQKLGLNLPLIGASAPIDKFYARRKGWEEVFKERGVPFSNDYLAGGSNLKKPKKIQAALGLAGHPISQDDARAFSLKHGGGIEDDWTDGSSVSKLASLLK